VVAVCIATLAMWGCGKEQPSPGASEKVVPSTKKAVEEKVAPYTYPAPVKGHYKEINIGEFDLVDGIAYPATGGAGTVVYVADKPIASPMIAGSACPMTQARVLAELRNAKYLEVTLTHGTSKYFAAGTYFGGSSGEQEVGGRYWSSRMKEDPERAIGSVLHKRQGSFDFDLPLSSPKVKEVSEGERTQGNRYDVTAPKPTEQAVTAAYRAMHDAALKKNLKDLLAAQGFDAKQIAAIRGREGIDADFMVYADRFLVPSAADEVSVKPGTGYLRTEGSNSKGQKFANFYHFAPCGDHLVLVSIAENPQ
ncbi:MAG TPA: hypothetical protein VN989_00885, partial [Casimicrobiaceae bacterium]|nr:hypothetical protein [Casimicrobiaceae bacterium]